MVKQSRQVALIRRRQRVAELALQGCSPAEIAAELGVSQGAISLDLKLVRKQWREAAIRNYDEARSIELRKLDLIEREAWSAWKRSQQPQTSAVISGENSAEKSAVEAGETPATKGRAAKGRAAKGKDGRATEKTRKSVANRYGDPRFLQQINKCIAQRRALLGLDIEGCEYQEAAEGAVDLEARRRRVEELLATIAARRVAGEGSVVEEGGAEELSWGR